MTIPAWGGGRCRRRPPPRASQRWVRDRVRAGHRAGCLEVLIQQKGSSGTRRTRSHTQTPSYVPTTRRSSQSTGRRQVARCLKPVQSPRPTDHFGGCVYPRLMEPTVEERLGRIREVADRGLRYYATAHLNTDVAERHTIAEGDLLRAYMTELSNVMAILEGEDIGDRAMLAMRHGVIDRYLEAARDDPWTPPTAHRGTRDR